MPPEPDQARLQQALRALVDPELEALLEARSGEG